MKNDFIAALPLIQKLRDLDVEQVIKLGLKLYEKYRKIDIEKVFLKLTEEVEK